MTIRLLSLLATLNKAVKAEPPVVTLALLATLKEVEEEIKQARSGFGLVLSLNYHWFCMKVLCQPTARRVGGGLEQEFCIKLHVKVKYTTPRGSKHKFCNKIFLVAYIGQSRGSLTACNPPAHRPHRAHSSHDTIQSKLIHQTFLRGSSCLMRLHHHNYNLRRIMKHSRVILSLSTRLAPH